MEAVWIKHKLGLAVDAGNTPHHILNIAANFKKLNFKYWTKWTIIYDGFRIKNTDFSFLMVILELVNRLFKKLKRCKVTVHQINCLKIHNVMIICFCLSFIYYDKTIVVKLSVSFTKNEDSLICIKPKRSKLLK